jgi:MFS family permease
VLKRTLPYALAQFFTVALQWMTLLYLPLYLSDLGLSDSRLGSLISIFSLATLVSVLPLGILADRLPPRPMMLVGALVSALANLYLPRAAGFPGLALGVFVDGLGFTLSSIALYSLFFKQVATDRRGLEISIFAIGGNLGAGAGAWSCGQLIGLAGYGVIFALGAAFALAWAGFALLLPRTRGIAFPILEYGQDLKRGRAWVLIAIFFVTASHAGFEQAGYGLLQRQVLHLSDSAIGGMFMALGIWMAIVTAWSGRLCDREQRPVLMCAIALLVSGAFMAASGSARSGAEFLFYRVLHTTGDAVFSLLILVLAASIFPRRRAGGAFAFAITVNTTSYFIFANLAGVVGQKYGFDSSFHLAGAFEFAGGLLLLLFRRRLARLFAGETGAEPAFRATPYTEI